MKYDTQGTYEIEYKAVDECGNETTGKRNVVVTEPVTYSTVLFKDGTLIINEVSTDRESNIEKYGEVVNTYVPLDEDNNYNFTGTSQRPWNNKSQSVKSVKFGSEVKPVSIAFWFQACGNLASIDWTNFNGAEVTTARALVASTAITTLDLPKMPKLENIKFLANRCESLTKADLSKVNTTVLKDTTDAFQGCYELLTVDLRNNSGTVQTCDRMFANVANDDKGDMKITTIWTSESDDYSLDFQKATSSGNMFRSCTSIKGDMGTTYDSSKIDKTYARIDAQFPPDFPKGYFCGITIEE